MDSPVHHWDRPATWGPHLKDPWETGHRLGHRQLEARTGHQRLRGNPVPVPTLFSSMIACYFPLLLIDVVV